MFVLRRRDFVTLIGGAAVWPLTAWAQQARPCPRIGVLNPFVENDAEARANLTAFRQTLEKLGWSDGRNVRIDYRWGSADPARIRAHAKELVSLDPDVILVSTALALQPLQQETRSIAIVFAQITDPVGSDLAAQQSPARVIGTNPAGSLPHLAPSETSWLVATERSSWPLRAGEILREAGVSLFRRSGTTSKAPSR